MINSLIPYDVMSYDMNLFFQNLPPFPAVSVTSASHLPEIKIEVIPATNWALLFSIHLNRNQNINPVTPIKSIWPLQILPPAPPESCKFFSKWINSWDNSIQSKLLLHDIPHNFPHGLVPLWNLHFMLDLFGVGGQDQCPYQVCLRYK